MKKLITLLFVSALLFNSCSSDDDGSDTEPASILGEWIATSINYDGTASGMFQGFPVISQIDGEGSNINLTVEFTEMPNQVEVDGSFDLETTITTLGVPQTTTTEDVDLFDEGEGTWARSGDQLTIESEGQATTATIVSLTDAVLILEVAQQQDVMQSGFSGIANVNATIIFNKN